MKTTIPFHKPYIGKEEERAVKQVLSSGILRGDGPASRNTENLIRKDLGVKYAFLTTSCTHALEIALLSLGLNKGDEVIMPSFTFVSSANAALIGGATPVFADITEDTLNLDPEDVARKITPRTRAIIPVHYSGVAADMGKLMDLSRSYDIPVIEDAAQAVDAWYKDRHLGTLGLMGCYSFHDTKNITCGEGGAIVTNDAGLARQIEIVREKGTNRTAFLRGEIDRYTWIDRGSSYILSDILASLLEVQWNKRIKIRQLREYAWQFYHQALEPFELNEQLRRPVIPVYAESNYHTYYFVTNRTKDRDPLLESFRKAGISATFHYIPLHSSPFGKTFVRNPNELPRTDRLSASLIRLPLYPALHQEHPDHAERAAGVLSSYFQNR
ncbi:MAG: dTDP-4-amino-4,6-dideoxygalactose transaminase [Balneolales bacterium]